jgi:hypothetical protein
MKTQKVIIAMPTEEDFMPSFSRWAHQFDWSKTEAHFIHIVQKNYAVNDMGITQIPDDKTFNEIKSGTLNFIKKKAHEIMPEKAFDHAHFDVFFNYSPQEGMIKYAHTINANMIVVATRNKKGIVGFFTSSFAEAMLKFSPCDVLIIRPSAQEN